MLSSTNFLIDFKIKRASIRRERKRKFSSSRLFASSTLKLIWNVDYEFAFNSGDTWKTLNVAGSPRQRTVTDSDLYAQMEAMLMEPVSGSVWTGTDQFNIEMFRQRSSTGATSSCFSRPRTR